MKHNVFDAKASETFKKIEAASWKIRYGDGSTASGIVDTANVPLGGLCIENQAIGLANKLSPQFTSGAGDGLLGLGFGHISTVKPMKVATPVEQRINQSNIPSESELFTCYLGSCRDTSDVDAGESFCTFGYIDESVLTGCGVSEPQYVPIDSSRGF
ncbi:aspartic peptidase domain-containing protein [Alternaria rosae]|uniref:aspartic peptidase domain-containing protein n=1 Tax=Alternaria rosae TaxID=1187941 RepID=UPI001E8E7C08|nr:aspartic peptidase domain-containing protein [Alternaria rosae]KAH6876073.1 aspartic peptidase domain-containing protein [Alternaria rosae]